MHFNFQSLFVIILLMLSVSRCPKVITLTALYCIIILNVLLSEVIIILSFRCVFYLSQPRYQLVQTMQQKCLVLLQRSPSKHYIFIDHINSIKTVILITLRSFNCIYQCYILFKIFYFVWHSFLIDKVDVCI